MIKRDKTQIAFLQDSHHTDAEHTKLNRMGFKHVYSYKTGHRRGEATCISYIALNYNTNNNNNNFYVYSAFHDTEGHFTESLWLS